MTPHSKGELLAYSSPTTSRQQTPLLILSEFKKFLIDTWSKMAFGSSSKFSPTAREVACNHGQTLAREY
jgi:hypothetical protein